MELANLKKLICSDCTAKNCAECKIPVMIFEAGMKIPTIEAEVVPLDSLPDLKDVPSISMKELEDMCEPKDPQPMAKVKISPLPDIKITSASNNDTEEEHVTVLNPPRVIKHSCTHKVSKLRKERRERIEKIVKQIGLPNKCGKYREVFKVMAEMPGGFNPVLEAKKNGYNSSRVIEFICTDRKMVDKCISALAVVRKRKEEAEKAAKKAEVYKIIDTSKQQLQQA
jgi:hypothetical protein